MNPKSSCLTTPIQRMPANNFEAFLPAFFSRVFALQWTKKFVTSISFVVEPYPLSRSCPRMRKDRMCLKDILSLMPRNSNGLTAKPQVQQSHQLDRTFASPYTLDGTQERTLRYPDRPKSLFHLRLKHSRTFPGCSKTVSPPPLEEAEKMSLMNPTARLGKWILHSFLQISTRTMSGLWTLSHRHYYSPRRMLRGLGL